ncbi:MAG: threonylcarbamoyl-AMP synthase [Planctomycetes bacterium]|nr:threonylcarbamoyl-AMP synthase [Planctomycetota bacterium]
MPTDVISIADGTEQPAELARAGALLRAGGLVAFPTETVYGIAVAATIPAAIERLYRVKQRPASKPMTLMVSDVAEVRRRCPKIPKAAERLIARFWPGPLTLVLRDAEGRMTGFRWPNHPLALGLVKAALVPLYVPSANVSDRPPATTAEAVLREFPDELDLVIDGGSAAGGVPSSVVQVDDDGRVEVLREGAIPEARLLDPTALHVLFVCTGNTDRSPLLAAAFRRQLAMRLGCREDQLARRGVVVRSAGTAAHEGEPASERALRAAAEWPGGPLDVSGHRATLLTERLVADATHIVCMERLHRDQILAFFPARTREVTLVDPEGHDVEDPAGQPPAVYRRLAARLEAAATLLAGALAGCVSSS